MRQSKTVRLCVMEEQELYRDVYESLTSKAGIELLRLSTGSRDGMVKEISNICPDVMLVSARRLDGNMVKEFEQIRLTYPQLAFVLLLAFCNAQDMELLRKMLVAGKGGVALFLKPSLDSVEQLFNIIMAASQGQIILDPSFTTLLSTKTPEFPFLKQLTTRELEILNLLSKGYTNASIAHKLYIDLKTVEHHINNLYGKLKTVADFGNGHPRVNAARLYLEATGALLSATAS